MTFATTDDGTRIAYRTLGSGPIDLVLVHSWSNSSVVYEDMLSGFELNDVRSFSPTRAAPASPASRLRATRWIGTRET